MAKAKTIRLEISDSGIRHDAEERSLIERLQGGDQAAFQTLWRRVERRVTGTANRMLRNGPEVDDVVSYVAQKVWGKISSFRFESSLSTWVCRIAVRRCLTELGRRKRNQERYDPIDDSSGAEDSGQWRENVEGVLDIAHQIFAQLKPNHQRIIDLVYWQGKSTEGAASLVGENEDHVRYVLRRFGKMVANEVKAHVPGQRVEARSKPEKVSRSKKRSAAG